MIEYNNMKWGKPDEYGYYWKRINGKQNRLHRYIYEQEQANLIEGMVIHHLDYDKENNDINNLVQISKELHTWIHSMDRNNVTNKRISESKKGQGSREVVQVETGIIFKSLTNAAKFMKLKSTVSITLSCSGKQKKAAGYHWEYV